MSTPSIEWKNILHVDGDPVTKRGEKLVIAFNDIIDAADYEEYLSAGDDGDKLALASGAVSYHSLFVAMAKNASTSELNNTIATLKLMLDARCDSNQ